MPPACPVDTYVLSYCSKERNDPPGKPVAFKVASMLSLVARNVTIHRASRWHSKWLRVQSPVARNVTIHRASRWHSRWLRCCPL